MILTWLYAPAHSKHAPKALAGTADVVILDLEDSVAADLKGQARRAAQELVAGSPDRPIEVRINAAGTPWHAEDIQMVRDLPYAVGIRIPKVDSAAQAYAIANVFDGRRVHALIETAAGLENIGAICAELPLAATVGLGEADLSSDLGCAGDEALAWARSRVVVASAAHDMDPPSMSVFTNVHDEAGLRRHCATGRRLGFVGQAAIHPAQVPVIQQEYSPTEPEAARALEVLESLDKAAQVGSSTYVLPDGTFLDPAMIRLAQRTVSIHHRTRKSADT